MSRYSEFINFPIYLLSTKEVEVPVEEEETKEEAASEEEEGKEDEEEDEGEHARGGQRRWCVCCACCEGASKPLTAPAPAPARTLCAGGRCWACLGLGQG